MNYLAIWLLPIILGCGALALLLEVGEQHADEEVEHEHRAEDPARATRVEHDEGGERSLLGRIDLHVVY